MSQRNPSITARGARQQSVSGPPTQQTVTVAVLPPRLPEGVAPPTGLGPADVFSWQESINWSHNEKIIDPANEPTGAKKWIKKAGLTTQRKKATEAPPFIMREVPYDVWRKHYAKDKDGRFKGTGTPAEDCLLLPEDVEKWRFGPPQTKADQWTRGKAALPAYADASTIDDLPEYVESAPPVDSRTLSTSSAQSANPDAPAESSAASSSAPLQRTASTFTADGKTSEQIIQEAKERSEAEKAAGGRWKQTMKKGFERGLLSI